MDDSMQNVSTNCISQTYCQQGVDSCLLAPFFLCFILFSFNLICVHKIETAMIVLKKYTGNSLWRDI